MSVGGGKAERSGEWKRGNKGMIVSFRAVKIDKTKNEPLVNSRRRFYFIVIIEFSKMLVIGSYFHIPFHQAKSVPLIECHCDGSHRLFTKSDGRS
jgi:hypothetical protein